jgi:chromosome segregation ATPase
MSNDMARPPPAPQGKWQTDRLMAVKGDVGGPVSLTGVSKELVSTFRQLSNHGDSIQQLAEELWTEINAIERRGEVLQRYAAKLAALQSQLTSSKEEFQRTTHTRMSEVTLEESDLASELLQITETERRVRHVRLQQETQISRLLAQISNLTAECERLAELSALSEKERIRFSKLRDEWENAYRMNNTVKAHQRQLAREIKSHEQELLRLSQTLPVVLSQKRQTEKQIADLEKQRETACAEQINRMAELKLERSSMREKEAELKSDGMKRSRRIEHMTPTICELDSIIELLDCRVRTTRIEVSKARIELNELHQKRRDLKINQVLKTSIESSRRRIVNSIAEIECEIENARGLKLRFCQEIRNTGYDIQTPSRQLPALNLIDRFWRQIDDELLRWRRNDGEEGDLLEDWLQLLEDEARIEPRVAHL